MMLWTAVGLDKFSIYLHEHFVQKMGHYYCCLLAFFLILPSFSLDFTNYVKFHYRCIIPDIESQIEFSHILEKLLVRNPFSMFVIFFSSPPPPPWVSDQVVCSLMQFDEVIT